MDIKSRQGCNNNAKPLNVTKFLYYFLNKYLDVQLKCFYICQYVVHNY